MKSIFLQTILFLFIFVSAAGLVFQSSRPVYEFMSHFVNPDLVPDIPPKGEKLDVATVFRVIDGDTIELSDGRRVRYIGIDTPETIDPRRTVGCFGMEAKEANIRLVSGQDVRLVRDISETDTYGRLLRYVYAGDIFVNEYMVRQGYATVSTYPPDVAHQQTFVEAELEARSEAKGLWSACDSPVAVPDQMFANDECFIKGNIAFSGEKIFHTPGCGHYDRTLISESAGERWFCSETEATMAGWRKADNCP